MHKLSMDRVRALIKRALVDQGWTALPGPALAEKVYATAVGPKSAHVFLADFGADSSNYSLTGYYWTEGRNCLEPCGVLIPKASSATGVAEHVALFAKGADAAVAQSYAVRLLSRGVSVH